MESKRMEPKQAESETRRRMQDKRLGCLLVFPTVQCSAPALCVCRDAEELRRPESLSLTHDRERQQAPRGYVDRAERGSSDFSCLTSLPNAHNQVSHSDADLHRRREHLVERTRREAQLAVLQFEEEKMRTKQIQREAVLDFVKQKASQSPQKQNPLDNECPFPSRKSHHTDDSALLVVRILHEAALFPWRHP
ncbi:UNVERIFIED_CONTAM: hypothetical protein K2H54_064115 [Gekko kuhli]